MTFEPSRRSFVAGGAGVLGGVVGAITLAPAAHAAIDYTPGHWPATQVLPSDQRHLVSRFSYGLTPELATQVRAKGGARKWFGHQLSLDDKAYGLADWWPHLHLGPNNIWQLQVSGTRGGYRVMYDVGRRLLARRIISPNPVLEVMTEFWENLLNVPTNGDSHFTWRAPYGELIRKHALGRFDELLPAAITHPAMQIYLDGANSHKDQPNENLARELLELHTVGVGGFGEKDVKHAARLLTGFHIDNRTTWRAKYDRTAHATGKVRVLGFTHDNDKPDGREATVKMLRYLAHHPRTARRIARRLVCVFVSDAPNEALVKRLSKVYLKSNTRIKPVLEALVDSAEFKAAADRKVRDPSQDVVATFRVLGTKFSRLPGQDDTSAASLMVHMADKVGLAPMAWPLPDGSPQVNEPWSWPARVMASFDMHFKMAERSFPTDGITYRAPADWLPAPSITLRDLVDHLARVIHHRPSTAALLQGCCEAVEFPPGEVITSSHPLVEFRMSRLLVVLLDHPTHFSR